MTQTELVNKALNAVGTETYRKVRVLLFTQGNPSPVEMSVFKAVEVKDVLVISAILPTPEKDVCQITTFGE